MKSDYPCYLAGKPVWSDKHIQVINKFNGETVAKVAYGDTTMIDQAIMAAQSAFSVTRKMPAYTRQAILNSIAEQIDKRKEEFAEVLAIEVGKPLKDGRGEITRATETFRIAAEESTRLYGEVIPLDISARSAGYEAISKRFPVGPCAFITPFNFPVNLAAHKIAPAIACGCPFILKPASATPITSIMLGEILAQTELPPASFSIIPCSGAQAELMVIDERIKHLSFTGSAEVGWRLKAIAGKKSVTLELGGNAACIVDRDADLEYAAERIVMGAYYQSGQSCISVQRILAQADIYEKLKSLLIKKIGALKMGDPLKEDTFLGPLISEADAIRVENWVKEAADQGARVLIGGGRIGSCVEATLIENISRDMKVSCDEVFGPVATLQSFNDFAGACEIANDSRYGLQAGVFTRDLNHAFYAYDILETGGVVINDVPSFRVDSMPYGGVKDSGIGREGVRYAIEEMTELKTMVLNNAGRLHDPGK